VRAVIEPMDEDERQQLLRELVTERFGRRPYRPRIEETPEVIADRRRVLCGIDKRRRAP
jgi:hypothetical protein